MATPWMQSMRLNNAAEVSYLYDLDAAQFGHAVASALYADALIDALLAEGL